MVEAGTEVVAALAEAVILVGIMAAWGLVQAIMEEATIPITVGMAVIMVIHPLWSLRQ